MEIPRQFDPATRESALYQEWQAAGAFAPQQQPETDPYCIVIPPPNVTGALHLGHAINNTLQDVLIRHMRMRGKNTVWIPGMDHAGIATQAVVEKQLLETEGLTRNDIGRDALVARIWQWKEQFGERILNQLRAMGCSCDWSRTRFTLDDTCARAVRHTFFRLFKDGLIYRGRRLVNWDAHLQTAVSDDEVYYESVKGHLWYFRYPIEDSEEALLVATTRPETMLGDTAVAVHPDDTRYAHLIGKYVLLPLVNRRIPVIADEILVDPTFGTGCVKVTPAHDPNDYECGLRANLEMINILTPQGTLNDNAGPFAGMERYVARKAVVEALKEQGLCEKIEPYDTQVGHSDRSKTPIEPYLSDQWFVSMAELATTAMDVVEKERIAFHPPRYAKMYLDWLSEKRDWPISRQLWWGHRIPIWYAQGCTEDHLAAAFKNRDDVVWTHDADNDQWLICADTEDLAQDAVPGVTLTRDPDVLDTWFSSALWPHATLGWPEIPADNAQWYPTNTLITSRDIVTLWVARMVMMGMYNMGDIPFDDVVIHIKILDGQGQTMSKSKGNGVDPMDIIARYGADALRFSVTHMATETQDVRMPVLYVCPHCGETTPQTEENMRVPTLVCAHCGKTMATRTADATTQQEHGLALLTSDKFDMGRTFANKLWNASRFVLMNLPVGIPVVPFHELAAHVPPEKRSADDAWICAHLAKTLTDVTHALETFRFHEYAARMYDFTWNYFCDWYVEAAKHDLYGDDPERARTTQIVLASVLSTLLRLLHPLMPYITEDIWQRLYGCVEAPMPSLLITAAWPQPAQETDDPRVTRVAKKYEIIRLGRSLRSAFNIAPGTRARFTIKPLTDELTSFLEEETPRMVRFLGAESLHIDKNFVPPHPLPGHVSADAEVYLHLDGAIDVEAEAARVRDQLAKTTAYIASLDKKLANEKFVANAPAEIVQKERDKRAEAEEQATRLHDMLTYLSPDSTP